MKQKRDTNNIIKKIDVRKKDILDLAGTIPTIKGKSVLMAREEMEKNYKRF